MHTTYHLGISFPHDIILSLLLILAFLNSVSALVTLRVSLRGCFEARVAGKRTTVKNFHSLFLVWYIPQLGDPNVDPEILWFLLWGLQDGPPNFGKPPFAFWEGLGFRVNPKP